MFNAELVRAFTAGKIARINPYGFALLPAYIGTFVAGDDTRVRADWRIARAVGVSAAVSVGYAAMFIVLLTALAFLGFRLRHRNVDKIGIEEAESEPTPSSSSLDQAATSETSSAP